MRQPWMLVVEGPEEEARAEAVAAALRVDRVTARLVAIARHPRVALRGDDPDALQEAAARLRAGAGLRAAVCSRAELLQVGPPVTALAALGPGWRATAAEAWTAEPDALPRGRAAPGFPVRLVVPGEVVVRRYRDGRGVGRSSRGERVLREAAERRAPVIDLHGPAGFLRLVAGVTDTTGLPGHDPSSALLSFKNLLEGFDAVWPGAHRLGARSCAPGLAPAGTEPGADAEVVEASGWPAWEEHTRCCRLWSGLPAEVPPLVEGA
jgi:hypothetical protein